MLNLQIKAFGTLELIITLVIISITSGAIFIAVGNSLKLSSNSIRRLQEKIEANNWSLSDLENCQEINDNLLQCFKDPNNQNILHYHFKSA